MQRHHRLLFQTAPPLAGDPRKGDAPHKVALAKKFLGLRHDETEAKFAAIDVDRRYSPEGRAQAKAEHARAVFAEHDDDAGKLLAPAEAERDAARAAIAKATAPKLDPAVAAEIRSALRSATLEERREIVAAIRRSRDATTAAALAQAPAWLSGVDEATHRHLAREVVEWAAPADQVAIVERLDRVLGDYARAREFVQHHVAEAVGVEAAKEFGLTPTTAKPSDAALSVAAVEAVGHEQFRQTVAAGAAE